MKTAITKGEAQRGNVLFLILIAVALFAALSYAVTSSSRTGGGDANKEKIDLDIAAIREYASGVRSTIMRLTLTGKASLDPLAANVLNFFGPDQYGDSNVTLSTLPTASAFMPQGGGISYQFVQDGQINRGPPGLNVSGSLMPPSWSFIAANEVKNIGTNVASGTTAGASSADLIAFLTNISETACKRINEKLGISTTLVTIPTVFLDPANNFPAGLVYGGGGVIGGTALDGQPEGCFLQDVNDWGYVYYQVLVER